MKIFAVLLTGILNLIVLASAAKAAELSPFKCENLMYRQALLQVDGGQLNIADSVGSLRELGILGDLEKASGLKDGSFLGYQLLLQVPQESLKCRTYGKLPMLCTGGDIAATLQVSGSLAGPDGQWVTIRRQIKVTSFYLKGQMTTPPGGVLETTSLSLDEYDIVLNVSLDINGVERKMRIQPFFNVGKEQKEYFYCQM